MKVVIEAIVPTDKPSVKGQYPYCVEYVLNDKPRRHYCDSLERAKEWADWATEIAGITMPTGISVDIRLFHTPFFVRYKVGKKKLNKYFASYAAAQAWLAEISG